MESDLRPATIVFISGVAFILLADVVLMAKDLRPVTDFLRTKTGTVFLVALGGHVLNVLGPADPFRSLAGLAGYYKQRYTKT